MYYGSNEYPQYMFSLKNKEYITHKKIGKKSILSMTIGYAINGPLMFLSNKVIIPP